MLMEKEKLLKILREANNKDKNLVIKAQLGTGLSYNTILRYIDGGTSNQSTEIALENWVVQHLMPRKKQAS